MNLPTRNKKISDNIDRCLIPKLSKNYEENTEHIEIYIRNKNLDQNLELLFQCLGDISLGNTTEHLTIISSLYILYKELKCDCPWNNEKAKDYSCKLNVYFEVLSDLPLDVVLVQESKFNVQEVFDKCLEALNRKLSSEDFKKYPSQIEVFYVILADLMKYNVVVKPLKVFPITILLIDDFVIQNKIKGLLCCLAALQCLKLKDFENGNYYEVVYRSLKKAILEKDIKITQLTLKCLIELLRIFPPDIKNIKLNDMYSGIIDQLITESDVVRKSECLKFTKHIIELHKVNCVIKNNFKMIICDCLDMCTNDTVSNVLLADTLQCLEQWITHCWCVWKVSSDYKIITNLLKVLYTCKEEENVADIQRIAIILICLCNEQEQKQIMENLEKVSCINNNMFKKRVEEIKEKIKF